MTKDQQAALEQVAREFLSSIPGVHDSGSMGSSYDEYVNDLVALLAAQRAAGLEAAAREARRRDRGAHKELYWLAEWLNAQAQEQRP